MNLLQDLIPFVDFYIMSLSRILRLEVLLILKKDFMIDSFLCDILKLNWMIVVVEVGRFFFEL